MYGTARSEVYQDKEGGVSYGESPVGIDKPSTGDGMKLPAKEPDWKKIRGFFEAVMLWDLNFDLISCFSPNLTQIKIILHKLTSFCIH